MPRLNLSEAETRDLILDEAGRLYTEIGYDKTTIADIARACGFSSANVHRVFGTKARINRAMAERKLQGQLAAARAIAFAEESAAHRLAAFYRAVHQMTLDTFTENQRVHHMVAAAIDERWEEVQHYRTGLMETCQEIVRYGVSRGEFDIRDVDATGRAVHMSGIRYCHPLAVAELDEAPDDVAFKSWMSLMLRGLGYQGELPLQQTPSATVAVA
ncbi:MAG: TetR family transcriptional regulator [Pseudomonadota bacterium]